MTLDCAILPIAFLYRQYLELKIKEIIETGRQLEGQSRGYPPTHSLKDLWAEAVGLLRKQYGHNQPPELAYIQPCIDEFHIHDQKSMAFRYPTDKDGQPHLQDIVHINLANLYETMERIGSLLDCLSMDLNDRLQSFFEMMAANDKDMSRRTSAHPCILAESIWLNSECL